MSYTSSRHHDLKSGALCHLLVSQSAALSDLSMEVQHCQNTKYTFFLNGLEIKDVSGSFFVGADYYHLEENIVLKLDSKRGGIRGLIHHQTGVNWFCETFHSCSLYAAGL